MQYRAPYLFSRSLGAQFLAGYRRQTRERFYGLGPGMVEDDEVVLTKEETAFHAELDWRVSRQLVAGLTAGLSATNLFDGDDSEYEGRLDTIQVRLGLTEEDLRSSRVLTLGTRFSYDFRNNAAQPSQGGLAIGELSFNRGLGEYDDLEFVRTRVELYGYLDLFLKRILAVRFIAQSIDKPSGSPAVPIYLKSSLGGYNDLRGYRSSRLVDDDMAVLTLEYRYPVVPAVDAFIFLDEGRVFSSITEDMTWRGWSYSTGVGFRLHGRERVLLTTLVAISKESVRFHLQMGAGW
jgi:outer membrane protein assembly factor BamA